MSRFVIVLLLILPVCLSGTTIDRSVGTGSASRVLNEARDQNLPHDITRWADIEKWPHEMQADFLGSYSPSYNNFTDTHALLPLSAGLSYKGTTIIAIEAVAWNKSKFHRDVSIRRMLIPHLSFWRYNRSTPTDEYERSYLGLNDQGDYIAGRMPEDAFQRIKNENQIELPDPVPYRFNMRQFQPDVPISPVVVTQQSSRNYGFELLAFILFFTALILIGKRLKKHRLSSC